MTGFYRDAEGIYHKQFRNDYPRAKGGLFGFAPGGVNREVAQSLAQQAKRTGGFTLHSQDLSEPVKGFAVSTYEGHERAIPLKDFDWKDVQQYIRDKSSITKRNKKVHIGAWEDNGKMYLDLTVVEPDRDKAIKLGVQHKQDGIYDLAAGETIMTNARGSRAPLAAREWVFISDSS